MTIGTAPLRNRELEIIEAEKDAQTIASLQRGLLPIQQARIVELEAEVQSMSPIVQSALGLKYHRDGHDVIIHESLFDPLEEAIEALLNDMPAPGFGEYMADRAAGVS